MDDRPPRPLPDGLWLGLVVPKRFARRAVTRNLLKRQIRGAMAENGPQGWPGGSWIVKLKAPFDPERFPSPASSALRVAVREELLQVLAAARHAATTSSASSAGRK